MGAGRHAAAGTSLVENSTCRSTDEIGAGGECRNTPLNTSSVDVEKLDGAVKLDPSHGSAGVCPGAARERGDPSVPITTTAVSVTATLASTFTDLARERWIDRLMLPVARATTASGR